MASEIRVMASLAINSGSQQHQSQPTSFLADMLGQAGPTPGSILVSKYGTDVNLSQIVYPGGWVRMINLDPTNYVQWGAYDLDSAGDFIPVGEMLPGEPALFRLSRQLGQEEGTGSGTASGASGVTLRLKAVGGACQVKVEAFDA